MNTVETLRKELRLIIRELGLLNHDCLNSGLTLAQAHILSYLKQNEGVTFSELVIQLGIDKASLSRILNNLATKEFIKIEKSNSDKRVKHVSILSLGREAIINGDCKSNNFINQILDLGDKDVNYNIAKSLKEFRILALKNNLIKDNSRIKIEKVPLNHMDDVIRLAVEVFSYEQNIPEKLMPINEELNPIWWCARVGEDIIGIIAGWTENNQWHLGRFAVNKMLRGLGVGKKMLIFSLNEIFNLGTEKIFAEARDITMKILEEFGYETVGKALHFYGDSVTPIVIKKCDFINKVKL